MNTFMPYSDFKQVAMCLDYKRLGKQRVECYQILRTLKGDSKGWINHPIVKMWRGKEVVLGQYATTMCEEWIKRGYKDTLKPKLEELQLYFLERGHNEIPSWIYDEELLKSHQSNLLRKDEQHYKQFFSVANDLPYKWVY